MTLVHWTKFALATLICVIILPNSAFTTIECNEFGFTCVNCTSFRLCPDFGLPPDHDIQTCISGFQCNMNSDLICDATCNVPDVECRTAGRFPDPMSCRFYYICTPDTEQGGFIRAKYQCPGKSNFNPIIRQCTNNYVANC